MVGIALFTAIVVVLQLLAVGLRALGLFSISLVLVPIVVGAAVYGWKAGAWLGFAFGAAVLLSGDAAAFLTIDVLGTVLVVLVKGTACGLVAGLVYKALERFGKLPAVIGAAIVCPIVNTGIFLLGSAVFFMPHAQAIGEMVGVDKAGFGVFIALAFGNFIIEVLMNGLLSPVFVRIIKIVKLGKK